MLTAAPSLDTRVGTTLAGKYLLERLIAVGGMASVYQAKHRNGNRVAVKILHPEAAINSELRSRFLREGRVANRIDHPGTTRVLDDDIAEDGAAFLVMDLLDGETLEARLDGGDGPLPADEVAALAWQTLDTLIAAHAVGVIHRDIKPDNLFLTREGALKVLDFGIAQLLHSGTPGSPALTRAGLVLGTPAFLPPEQALGRTQEIDARTDIWAVGATMFWLLSEALRPRGCHSRRALGFLGEPGGEASSIGRPPNPGGPRGRHRPRSRVQQTIAGTAPSKCNRRSTKRVPSRAPDESSRRPRRTGRDPNRRTGLIPVQRSPLLS